MTVTPPRQTVHKINGLGGRVMEFRVDGIIAVIAIDRPGKGRAEWRLTAESEADAVRIVTKAIKPGATVTVVTAVSKFVEV